MVPRSGGCRRLFAAEAQILSTAWSAVESRILSPAPPSRRERSIQRLALSSEISCSRHARFFREACGHSTAGRLPCCSQLHHLTGGLPAERLRDQPEAERTRQSLAEWLLLELLDLLGR